MLVSTKGPWPASSYLSKLGMDNFDLCGFDLWQDPNGKMIDTTDGG